jgi:hypothetical protein
MNSSRPSDSSSGDDNAASHPNATDKQTLALEKIADGVQSLRDDLRAIRGTLQRIANRGGFNDD